MGVPAKKTKSLNRRQEWCKLCGNSTRTPKRGEMMERRSLFSWLGAIPILAWNLGRAQGPQNTQKLKIMMKSAWGSDDPTRASFPFVHGLALAEAGHDVQIFLLAEATVLMRKSLVNAVFPVGCPPLTETLEKVVAKRIPIFA